MLLLWTFNNVLVLIKVKFEITIFCIKSGHLSALETT